MGFFDQGGKAVKFTAPGSGITGKVTGWREEQMRKYSPNGQGELDTWDDGSKKMQVVINLDTDERDSSVSDDDGARSLYIASTRQKRALINALRAGGSKEPDEGGTLTMTFVGNDPDSKNPANPAKMYQASWVKPPSIFNGLDASAAAQQAPAVPAPATAPQAAPAAVQAPAAGGGEVVEKVKSLVGLGLDDATIATALGITAEQVAALR